VTTPRRVKFLNVRFEELSDNRLQAQVELEWDGETYRGSADDVLLEHTELSCAARAACVALESLVAHTRTSFEYLSCQPIASTGQALAVAAVAVDSAVSHQFSVGVCRIKEDPGPAAVRAVLNAANRRLATLLGSRA
jgi:hypothetical protein